MGLQYVLFFRTSVSGKRSGYFVSKCQPPGITTSAQRRSRGNCLLRVSNSGYMAEAFTVDKLRGGHLGQHRLFFRRRCDDQGRVARRGIWALRLSSCLEHIHYVLTVNDAVAGSGIRRRGECGSVHSRIHFSSRCWLGFPEFIWIAEYPGPVFLDRISRNSHVHALTDTRKLRSEVEL